MKNLRYLFNCLSDPRRTTRLIPDLWRDRIERNPGDLAYEYAVMNALATNESTEFIPTRYYHFGGYSDDKIDWINETCSAFVCPLADVFSDDFLFLVKRLTVLIRRLRIPCVVPCVGLRATSGAWSAHSSDFNETVGAFIRAVLEKSAMIGVRGETTGRYLDAMGFVQGRHYMVVGCPTLYTYGESLPERSLTPPTQTERCAFHLNPRADDSGWAFIDHLAGQFKESVFVSQYWQVFRQFMMSNGKMTSELVESQPVFKALLSKYAAENRMRFFLNRTPWMQFLASMDFCIGHRIHGTLLSLLAGTPAAIVPFESRTDELAQFHGLPILSRERLGDTPDWESIQADLDYSRVRRRQKDNFANWLVFLRENGLPTVFDRPCGIPTEQSEFPLERQLPRRFPNDNIRAWPFNPPTVRVQMRIALSGKRAVRKYRDVKGRIKKRVKSMLRNRF